MNTVSTLTLAEAAFYLGKGLTLTKVDVAFNDEAGRTEARMVFSGEGFEELARQYNETPSPVVNPYHVARLMVALGTIGEAHV